MSMSSVANSPNASPGGKRTARDPIHDKENIGTLKLIRRAPSISELASNATPCCTPSALDDASRPDTVDPKALDALLIQAASVSQADGTTVGATADPDPADGPVSLPQLNETSASPTADATVDHVSCDTAASLPQSDATAVARTVRSTAPQAQRTPAELSDAALLLHFAHNAGRDLPMPKTSSSSIPPSTLAYRPSTSLTEYNTDAAHLMNAEAVRAPAVRARDALFTVALGAPPEDETEDEETDEEEEHPARIHASTPRLVHSRPVDTQHPDMDTMIASIRSAPGEPALHDLLRKLSDSSSKFSYATAGTAIQLHVRQLVREHPHVPVDSITPRIVEEHGLFITCPFSADGCTAVFLAERSAAEAHFRQEHQPRRIVSAQAPARADGIRTRSQAKGEGTSTAADQRVQCPTCATKMNFDSLGRHFVQSHKPTRRSTRTTYACKLCDGAVFTMQEHVAHFGECQEQHFAQWDGNMRAGKRRRIDTTDADEAAA